MTMQRFDELVSKRKQLSAWWELRKANDFSQGKYVMRVDVETCSLVAFCGQQCAGAKNYHDAPGWFMEQLRKAFQSHAIDITRAAVEAELALLTRLIEDEKNEVLAEFSR